jgi:copper resistance protein D
MIAPLLILVAARCVQYGSTSILFGASAYALYAARGGWRDQWLIRFAVVCALISGVAWLGYEAASLSGDSRGAFEPTTLAAVLTHTTFGELWTFRLILALIIVAAALFMRTLRGSWLTPLVLASGLLLVSLSGTGHAASDNALHRSVDMVHLTAAGIWLGGLCALALRVCANERPHRSEMLRFSNVALAAVAVLVATGIANAAFLIDWRQILHLAYGRVLLIKVALVVCMIGAAAVSRYRLNQDSSLHALRGSVFLEQGLGALVLIATSVLGTLSPTGN